MRTSNTRERLILKGMEEIRAHGVQGFSLRRVASECGVSCAAPYKHFNGKEDLFLAMIDYIVEKWDQRVRENLRLGSTVESTIAAYAKDYVIFLCENPHFKSILMLSDSGRETPLTSHIVGVSMPLARLFIMMKRKRGMSREELREHIFTVRSLMYGASIILDADDSDFSEHIETLERSVCASLMADY